MAKIALFLPDELLNYLQEKGKEPKALIETLVQEWRQQNQIEELAQACAIIDQLELGWTQEWQQAVIKDFQG
ncbi:conserved hypothetical protein [Gloeothece citriformis PCC 7424]|uniref:Uncharacterized protein n=1 Tax=Gloeothece citriformis (strain PCC 7424) TaxID=65393 RepID=B7KDC7_GLOC7|nr:hypothetical protein [Gloeothece citriformis]ACK68947.1 conserved hypothetical protein [Gloeothece citriformis PCC 7424]